MANILLTGETGFLGRSIARELETSGTTVFGLQSCSNKKIDITSPFDLVNKDFDLVIHSAGKAHSVPKSTEERNTFYKVNLEGTKNLCYAIDRLPHKPSAFIFISTVSVYGLSRGEKINEKHPLEGDSPYAESKILAEDFLKEWARERGIVLSILRLPLVAGENPPGNLGAMINGIKNGRYLSIGKADSRKSIVWSKDIASIVPALAKKGGVYNLTDGIHPSFGELESAISKGLNKSKPLRIPMPIAKFLAYIGDLLGSNSPINSDKLNKIVSTLTFDDSKAVTELGWRPSSVLDKIPEVFGEGDRH